ncbi:MAG TPA: acetylglutamate kinase [Steroidobacteraceae bacterium]|nr:acetylglutamate kinase [Steroidobacteraceae bacterium]
MMMNRPDPSIAVRALKSAAPYIRMYKNKVFVIKAGGAVFGEEASTRALIEQVAILHQVGIRTVLVHGGGPQLDHVQATLGIETRMVNGRRVTDQKSIEVTAMVLSGLINTRILAICRALDLEAVGLSGVDAGLIRAHKRAPVPLSGGSDETIDYGFVGDIDSVNVAVIERLLDGGFMPVVSPLSSDSSGTLLNINADTVAAAIGGALAAEKLVLCTGAPGILERSTDTSTLISYTDIKGLNRLRDAGSLTDGMLPKATAIESAIRSGVRRVHVITYKSPDSLLAEIFTNEGTGTLVVPDLTALSPAEQQSPALA